MSEKSKREYVVYVAVNPSFKNNDLKIGWTGNLTERLNVLSVGTPERYEAPVVIKCSSERTARNLEAKAHKALEKFKSRGEFFKVPQNVAEEVLVTLSKGKRIVIARESEPVEFASRKPIVIQNWGNCTVIKAA